MYLVLPMDPGLYGELNKTNKPIQICFEGIQLYAG